MHQRRKSTFKNTLPLSSLTIHPLSVVMYHCHTPLAAPNTPCKLLSHLEIAVLPPRCLWIPDCSFQLWISLPPGTNSVHTATLLLQSYLPHGNTSAISQKILDAAKINPVFWFYLPQNFATTWNYIMLLKKFKPPQFFLFSCILENKNLLPLPYAKSACR